MNVTWHESTPDLGHKHRQHDTVSSESARPPKNRKDPDGTNKTKQVEGVSVDFIFKILNYHNNVHINYNINNRLLVLIEWYLL